MFKFQNNSVFSWTRSDANKASRKWQCTFLKKEWDERKETNCINKQIFLCLAMVFQVQILDVSE